MFTRGLINETSQIAIILLSQFNSYTPKIKQSSYISAYDYLLTLWFSRLKCLVLIVITALKVGVFCYASSHPHAHILDRALPASICSLMDN